MEFDRVTNSYSLSESEKTATHWPNRVIPADNIDVLIQALPEILKRLIEERDSPNDFLSARKLQARYQANRKILALEEARQTIMACVEETSYFDALHQEIAEHLSQENGEN